MLREVSTTFKKLMDKKWKEFAHPCSWGPVRSHGREQGKYSEYSPRGEEAVKVRSPGGS